MYPSFCTAVSTALPNIATDALRPRAHDVTVLAGSRSKHGTAENRNRDWMDITKRSIGNPVERRPRLDWDRHIGRWLVRQCFTARGSEQGPARPARTACYVVRQGCVLSARPRHPVVQCQRPEGGLRKMRRSFRIRQLKLVRTPPSRAGAASAKTTTKPRRSDHTDLDPSE